MDQSYILTFGVLFAVVGTFILAVAFYVVIRSTLKSGDMKINPPQHLQEDMCYNGGGMHRYRARFEDAPNPYATDIKTIEPVEKVRSVLYYKRYLGDICEWCGRWAVDEIQEGPKT